MMSIPRAIFAALLTAAAVIGVASAVGREDARLSVEGTPPALTPEQDPLDDLYNIKKEVAAGTLGADTLYNLMSDGNARGKFAAVVELAEVALGTPPPAKAEAERNAAALAAAGEDGGAPLLDAAFYIGSPAYENDARIFNEAGVAYFMAARAADAKWAYDEARRIDPRASEATANLGLLYRRKGRYAEAIAYYDEALAITPADATIWYNRAVCLLRLGRLEEALSALETATRLSPKYGSPLRRLALLWYELGDFKVALAYAEKYEYLTRTDPFASSAETEDALRLLAAIQKRLAGPAPEPAFTAGGESKSAPEREPAPRKRRP